MKLEWLNGINFKVVFRWASGKICLDKHTCGARTVCEIEVGCLDKLGGVICLAVDLKFRVKCTSNAGSLFNVCSS